MSQEITPYDEFKTKIETILKAEPNGLTWTDIKKRLSLPQKVPNNKWVRMMETDIGLMRQTEKGKIIWRLR